MKRMYQVLLPVLFAVTFAVQASGSTNAPNILYLFTDDHSYRTVSCYPRCYDFANTPNIDALAERGVRFDQAYIGAKCVPSRATALTGRLQFAVESDYDGNDIPGSIHWFPTLRSNGYYTGMIGKWHYRQQGAEAYQHGTSWDWSVIWKHQDVSVGDSYYWDQYVSIDGGSPEPLNGYSTDRYTDYVEGFISDRAAETNTPWFLWVCYGAVHGPYTPADRHIGMLAGEPEPPIPVDIYGPRFGKPYHFQDTKWSPGLDGKPVLDGNTLEFWVKQQVEAVAAIDESVGRIVQALEDTGQLDNTIIVFTADQGYVWGQHGLKGKIDPYETAIRSPFIVSNPTRFPTNKVCKAPINGPDVIRTFHAWADAEPQQFMPGRDITPLVENPDSEPVLKEWSEVPTMMTYVQNRYEPMEMAARLANEDWEACMYDTDTPWYFMILVENYKYTRYANPDRIEELYDLDSDPEELDNLAIKPQFKSKVLEMRSACTQSIKDNGGIVFADLLPPPKTEAWWPYLYSSDNAHVLYGSDTAQDDSEVLQTKNGWGAGDSRLAYVRFNLSGVSEIGNHPSDSILSVSLDLWMTQTEGDVANELQVYALVDGAQDSPSGLSESTWTGSIGPNPLLGTNLPQGNNDPAGSALTTAMLGSHTFAATGDNSELGLLQIPLTVADFKMLLEDDSNGEITLIVRSTSTDSSVEFASMNTANSQHAVPTLTVTALPDAPKGLEATPGNGVVLLDWADNTEQAVMSYNVYRSTTAGGTGATLLTNVNASIYADNNLENGITYYYTVSAMDGFGNESSKSAEVPATPDENATLPGKILFGSDFEGLAGFTHSTEGATEIWTIQTNSVRCRGEELGFNDASLLKEFPLVRSEGSSYTIEGVVHLTDGYAADNNRVGIYLFGDTSEVPGDKEAGALSLQLNLDGCDLNIREGLNDAIRATTPKNGTIGQALFGTELTFTAKIVFTNATDIFVEFILADEDGNLTAVNTTVDAASYTGDWFGFATRARSRNYGVTGDPKSDPFVMDYMSFRVADNSAPVLVGYDLWVTKWGTNDIGSATNDFDFDGLKNLYEYALDGNPTNALDQGSLPVFSKSGSSFIFVHPKRSDDTNITYTVETTTNLMSGVWTNEGYTVTGTNITGGTLNFVTNDIDTVRNCNFIRLKIEN